MRQLGALATALLLANVLACGGKPEGNEGAPSAPKGNRVEEAATVLDPEKEAFLTIVRQNAEDPSRLEIVDWGEKKDGKRDFKFRCARVGYHTESGAPVMLETGRIFYHPDGRIKQVLCSKLDKFWYPKK